MSAIKMCGKCNKTVYPTEQIQCLDKYWHKGCFKCEVCGMTLTMKNYKGYNKTPYCNAHYPTTKHTVVADTPENRRIAENTKIQSTIQYHRDYEDNKANVSQIVDTPEMTTHMKNSHNFSLVKYHAEFERQKGCKTSVVDDPETARIKKNTNIQSNVSYWGVREQRSAMESKRPNEVVDDVSTRKQPGKISDYDPTMDQPSPYTQRSSANVVYDSQKGGHGEIRQQGSQRSSTHGGYAPFSYGGSASSAAQPPPPSAADSVQYRNSGDMSGGGNRNSNGDGYSDRNRPTSNRVSGGGYGSESPTSGYSQQPQQNRGSYGYDAGSNPRPYSYGNPQQGNPQPSYGNSQSPRNSGGYNQGNSGGGGGGGSGGYQRSSGGQFPAQIQGQRVQPGSIADYDPMNERHSSIVGHNQQQQQQQRGGYQQPPPPQQPQYQPPPPQQPQPQPPPPQQPPPQKQQPQQVRYRAMYDYTAADDDEVSFSEGDLITNCEIIDAGWMTGVVMRTGLHGMLPSNYVERV